MYPPGVTWLFCGERACPALGCEAAPKAVIRIYLEKRGALDGAASRPGAGQARSPQKPAHHKKSVHHYAGAPSPKIIPLQKTCHRVTECIQPGVTWLFVVSVHAPRRAAKRTHKVFSGFRFNSVVFMV